MTELGEGVLGHVPPPRSSQTCQCCGFESEKNLGEIILTIINESDVNRFPAVEDPNNFRESMRAQVKGAHTHTHKKKTHEDPRSLGKHLRGQYSFSTARVILN